MKRNGYRAFSITELLVVIAVILILASIILVGSGEIYGQALQLKCQNHLEQIGYALQLHSNKNGGQLVRYFDLPSGRRWYHALRADGYLDNPEVFLCPSADWTEQSTRGGAFQQNSLPVLMYNVATGRYGPCSISWDGTGTRPSLYRPDTNNWGTWGHFVEFRQWTHSNLEYGVLWPQGDADELLPVTHEMLIQSSQVWFMNTEHYTWRPGQNVFDPPERVAMKAFYDRGGGVQCWSEAYAGDTDCYYRSTNNVLEALGVGMRAGFVNMGNNNLDWNIHSSTHPLLNDSAGPILKMRSRTTTAKFWKTTDPHNYGTLLYGDNNSGGSSVALFAAWDDGNARVVLHGSYTSLVHPSCQSDGIAGWPEYDIQRYCLTSEKWLRNSGGLTFDGACSYGYNRLLGQDRRRVSSDTIVVMDYENWEINRQADDDSYIALRHRYRANALFADGVVRPLAFPEIQDKMFTPQSVD
jgi:type II secretory pathway pseudopilin PulG